MYHSFKVSYSDLSKLFYEERDSKSPHDFPSLTYIYLKILLSIPRLLKKKGPFGDLILILFQ